MSGKATITELEVLFTADTKAVDKAAAKKLFARALKAEVKTPPNLGEMVDSLSVMCHRSEAQNLGREITKKLKDIVPRQSFEVALQAAIGGKFIARETIGAYRKDVTAKLYGGDVSRRKKLLAKQAKGKQRMKRFGKVDIPAEAFTVMLKRD